MLELLLSVFVLIASVSIVYLWLTIDNIVNVALYQFGLQFSYDWANPYWMFMRISLVLLGLIAAASSVNIFYFFWRTFKKPALVTKTVEKAADTETATPGSSTPSLFQCISCGQSVTDPLKINICPFCHGRLAPVSYAYKQE